MKLSALLSIFVLAASMAFAAACSSESGNSAATKDAKAATDNTVANHQNAPKKDEDTPAVVKAAVPDAQSFTKQHKDIPKDAIATMEKDTGGKVPDTDHHSYLAFSTTGGARKQIGAVTVVTANGKEFVIVYENKGGSPYIKEVRGDGVPTAFLAQFAGKGHDDKFSVGVDVKANGLDDATAKAIALAIRIDAVTMQTLYGAAHSH